MEANLPTTPGPYWFREEDGDEWELVVVVFYNDPFMEPTAKYVCSEFENDLKAMHGQWAKAHKPDEGIEAWVVKDAEDSEVVAASSISSRDAVMKAWLVLGDPRETSHCPGGYTCEPVTIYRNQDQK